MLRSIVQHRRGTTNEWSASKVIPKEGEIVIEELDNGTKKIKLGDGITPFKDLPYISGSGGGEGSGGASLIISYITLSPVNVTVNDNIILKFEFHGTDSSGDTIQRANSTWKVNNSIVAYGTVKDGVNKFNITKYIEPGTSRVDLVVEDVNGNSNTKTWEVERINFFVTSDFNDKITYPAGEELVFEYIPTGAISKTAVFKLDGNEIGRDNSLDSTVSGIVKKYTIPAQSHGSHLLEVYLEGTMIDGTELPPTDPVIKDILFYDINAEIPVIGCATPNLKVKQYATENIVFTVYDPKADIPEVDIYVDKVFVSHMTLTSNEDYYKTPTGIYSYVGTEPGKHTIEIKCRDQVETINIELEKLDVNIAPITDGLVFDFNPVGKNNSDIENRLWNYNNEVHMTVSENFDWVNGGYIQNDADGACFLIKAGSSATIDYKLFADDAKKTGKEFKLIFKTKNVSNPDAVFLSCLDNTTEKDHIGIKMGAQGANIYGQSKNLELVYSEDDTIEFEFNISKNTDDVPMIMGYEDGVPSRPLVYDSTFSFTQNDPKPITLGSPDCDVYIYRFKVYNTSLTNVEILSNFIADARSVDDMISRYNRNQIYDKNNKLTAEALAEKCPWLRVYKVEAPYFTNNKKDKVPGTTITQIYKNGDPVLDNWVCYNAQHSGQGTSSNDYGASGRNLDFIMNKSGVKDELGNDIKPHFILGDGSRATKISMTRSSVPVAYLNAKVNIASSNNLTNAMLANRYNKFNPYKRPFIREADYPIDNIKDTMEFHNCVIFIKESNADLSTHREFADTDWHFYAIGNIGDSKKTDDTRLTDPSDRYECCVELMDVKLPLSDFPVDTMINAMAQKENKDKELEYVWAKDENLDILYERRYDLTTDTEVNLNKVYYIDLPVKVAATGPQLSIDNLENLYDRIYRLTEDTEVVKEHIYYYEDGSLVSEEELKNITNPNESNLYEWHKEYKKTTDKEIIDGKPYYVEIMEKTNAMGFTYENVRKYLTATDDNLKNLYEFIDGKYVKTQDTHVDLTKIYYTKYEERNANGDITNTTYTDAMGYVIEQVKVYTYAKNENLDKLYEITYFKTQDTAVDTSKVYYVDILEHDDFSEDYTYGWRYIDDEEDQDLIDSCKQAWINFYRFVTTSTDEEFKAHLSDYFVVDSALYYYLFTTRYCMVDNRAKNTFWHFSKTGKFHKVTDAHIRLLPIYYELVGKDYVLTTDTEINPNKTYYSQHAFDLCWDYDNDTSLGLNNYGKQVYRYGLEDTDVDASGEEVFREMDSMFFCRIRDLFGPELQVMYNTLEGKNAWHAESFINECDLWQEEFPEELWRLDIERKYIRTYTTSFINGKGEAQFLVNMCNGKMKYQRRQWERNQEQYMSSKYQTTRASGDNYHANFRFGGPSSTASSNAVPANYQLTLTPYSYMYLNVQYGGTTPSTVRVTDQNINTPITVPFYGNAADIVNVFSASSIRDFGDLSAAYPKTVSIGNASRVKKLTLGNSKAGYNNTVFTTLTTDANPLLEELDVTNISSLDQVLNLHKLTNLKVVKAFGTSTPNVLFADNGKLEYAELPAINGISLKNLSYLSSNNFKLESYNNVIDLMVENCPLIDKLDLLNKCTNLKRLRLTDVNLGTITYNYFEEKLFKLKGIAANGEDTIDNAWITGECYFEELTGEQYSELTTRYPGLKINFGKLYTKIIFMDIDCETKLSEVELIAEDSKPYAEYTEVIPTASSLISSKKYDYIADGWTTKKVNIPTADSKEYEEFAAPTKEENALKDILSVRIVYPAFKNNIRSYSVTFYNPRKSGNDKLITVITEYGTTAIFPLETPNKLEVSKPENYEFITWEPSVEYITGELDCFAQFKIKDSAWYIPTLSDFDDSAILNGEITLKGFKKKQEEVIIKIPEILVSDSGAYTVTSIGWSCFDSAALEHIELPNTVRTLEGYSFNNCASLVSVRLPDSLLDIKSKAFGQCRSLETIRIPKSVKTIEYHAFEQSTNLVNIEIDPENTYYYVANNCLIETNTKALHTSLQSNSIPSDGTVLHIASGAFMNSALTNIVIPECIKSIGDNAFSNCKQLTEIIIPEGCTIGATAFGWCNNLTNVTLPSDITEIATYVFADCNIKTLVIPKNITSIKEYAFGGNTNLQLVDFETISLPTIHEKAFLSSGHSDGLTINVPWSEDEVKFAPWGAVNATINYNVDNE